MNLAMSPSVVHPRSPCTSNILGVTGLSPAALRAMFAETGLFGRESALRPCEQAAVYAELALPAGAVPALASSDDNAHPLQLAAIRSVVRSVLDCGRATRTVQDPPTTRAVSDAVRVEVLRTVRTAMLLYGVGRALVRDVTLATLPAQWNPAAARSA